MITGLIAMVFGVAMMIAVPIAIYAAIRAVNRAFSSDSALPPPNLAIEARLRRMEEAIDAMAVQIERMRTGEEPRYVSGEDAEPRQLPPPDEPPTFR
ncbi:MAG: hypothetical protein ACT4P7_04975 [Gemmatimonadaceae bacterium]